MYNQLDFPELFTNLANIIVSTMFGEIQFCGVPTDDQPSGT